MPLLWVVLELLGCNPVMRVHQFRMSIVERK